MENKEMDKLARVIREERARLAMMLDDDLSDGMDRAIMRIVEECDLPEHESVENLVELLLMVQIVE